MEEAEMQKVKKASKTKIKVNVMMDRSNKDYDSEELLQEIWAKRKAEMRNMEKQLESEYTRSLAEMKKQYESDKKKLQKEETLVEKELDQQKAHLSTLVFFQWEEKKTVRERMNVLKEKKNAIHQKNQDLENNFEAEQNLLKYRIEQRRKNPYWEAKKKVPTPLEIKRSDYVLLEMEPGKAYTTQDLVELPGMPVQNKHTMVSFLTKTSSGIRHVKRTVKDGRVYFALHF